LPLHPLFGPSFGETADRHEPILRFGRGTPAFAPAAKPLDLEEGRYLLTLIINSLNGEFKKHRSLGRF
ncbi:MAG: hypothetical protein ACI3YC_01180, partial [Alloprevotella sp.]